MEGRFTFNAAGCPEGAGGFYPKSLTPGKLVKEYAWRTWREDVQDDCVLEPARRNKKTKIEESDIESAWWDQRQALYRFLRRYMDGALQKCIEAYLTKTDMTCGAYVKFIPSVGTKEADATRAFTELTMHRVKNLQDIRKMIARFNCGQDESLS